VNKGLINIIVKATDNATPNIRRIGQAIGGLGKVAGNIKKDFKVVGAGIAGLAVGLGAFAASAAAGAAADQQATATLNATLKARKFNTDALAESISNLIQQGQDLAFTDDQVRGSIEAATRFTNKFAVAQKITTAAMALSRSTGMDLQEATIQVGKAYQGTGDRTLKLIGINKKHLSGMEAVNAILGKTKGSAAAYANTAAGGFQIATIKLSEMRETLGYALLPAIEKVFKSLNPQLTDFANWMTGQMPRIQKYADDIANKIIARLPELFAKIKTYAPKALDAISGFADKISGIGKSANKLLGPGGDITVLVTGIGAAFGGLKGAITANLVKAGLDPFTSLIVSNIAAVIPGALADVFTKAVVTKAIAAFGTEVAAASAGGAAASGAASAATAGVGTATSATGLFAGIGGAAALAPAVLAILGVAAVIATINQIAQGANSPSEIARRKTEADKAAVGQGFRDLGIGGHYGLSPYIGPNADPMGAKYSPHLTMKVANKDFDVIVTDAMGRVLHSGAR
jgi:hypothetical protein